MQCTISVEILPAAPQLYKKSDLERSLKVIIIALFDRHISLPISGL